MRAVVLRNYGPPPDIVVTEAPAPALTSGCIRLRVHAVGVGFPDVLMMGGKYQTQPSAPFIPGNETAGVVMETAPDVVHVKRGDRVLAIAGQGGLAEECVAPVQTVVRVPDQMSLASAAGFLINYGTSYYALAHRAELRPAESLIVLGASGGVGLAAVEIGKALGARVLAGASTPEKRALALEAGADAVFDYTSEPIKQKVMDFTGGRGADVAYDPVGADCAEQLVRSMAWNGRYLVVGFAGGRIPAIPLNLPLLKGCSLVGVFWGGHIRREVELHTNIVNALMRLHEERRIRPLVTELRGLERFTEALELIQARRAMGKFVIRLADE